MIISSWEVGSAGRRRRPETAIRLAGILVGGLAVGLVLGLALPALPALPTLPAR
jgi:hypothetical protein